VASSTCEKKEGDTELPYRLVHDRVAGSLNRSWTRKRRKGTHAAVPTYPNALRSCIKQAGYSFREVSRETAIPESTLYSWASGKQVIPHASRERLAQVIGCAVEELAPKRLGVPV
jgi:lambda repressor-like predicted transcriptional regulator